MNTPINMAQFAAKVCGMAQPGRDFVKITKAVINSDDTKGLYQYQYTGSEGLELDCYLEYEPAERQTQWEPGCPESITLVYALHKDEDISEVLSDDVRSTIEKEALADLHDRAKNSHDDARIEAYIDRMEAA